MAGLTKITGGGTGTIAGFTSTGIDDNATSTAITIDSSENVDLVGNLTISSSAPKTLRIENLSASLLAGMSAGRYEMYANDGSGGGTGVSGYMDSINTTNGTNYDLVFGTKNYGADATEKVRFLGTGGITFNGDTAAANALDDYEEGTFTPTYSSGFTGITYTTQTGKYTKTGNVVNFTIGITMSAATAVANHIVVAGLPFSSDSTNGFGSASISYSPFMDASSIPRLGLHTPVNSTGILMYTSTATLLGNNANVTPTGAFLIVGSYFTAT